jgi:APA family basic amino acid/polyamine antiporter
MTEVKRTLNLFDTIMLVSGSMIGSGIFIVTADMTRVLGSPLLVLLCWIISGVVTLFAALSYGELAAMMPSAGGQFIYIKRAYGRLTAFVYGWTVFTVIQTGVIAAVAVAFAKYTGVFIPFFNEKNVIIGIGAFAVSAPQLLGVACILFLTYLNTLGINNGKIIQRIFTSAKLLALLGLIILGFIYGGGSGYWAQNIDLPFKDFTQTTGSTPPTFTILIGAIGVALIGSLFSSDAWNNVTFIAGEVKEPQKNIPLGLLTGVLIVTLLYILANVAYFMLLPAWGDPAATTVIGRGIAFAENDRVGSAALFPVFGAVSSSVMALLIIISTFGCNNGLILQGARLFQSMANEGLFFKPTGKLNKYLVPEVALWMQAAWASVLCLSGSYGALLDYCTFASLLFYVVTITALFYLRRIEPDTPRPYRAFGYPVIPALYILLAGGICIDLLIFKPQNTVVGLFIMSIGIPVYYFFNRNKNADILHK